MSLNIIDSKIKEHKNEIDKAIQLLDKLKQSVQPNDKPSLDLLQNMTILKDKIMFHKACAACLDDLREEMATNEI